METEKKHSPISPSASSRWLKCTKSVPYCKSLGLESKTSEYAQIGTAVHAVIEKCLKSDKKPYDFVGDTIENIEIDYPMAENANKMIEYVNMRDSELSFNSEIYSEIYVDLTFLDVPGLDGGTVDCAIVTDDLLCVVDYKNGSIRVDETCNSQLMIYAIGLIHKFDMKSGVVELTIVQPNAGGDTVRTYHTTVEDVLKWCEVVLLPKCKEILQGGKYHASEDTCRFCPANGVCGYLKNHLEKQAMIEFEQATLPDVMTLSVHQKAKIVEYADQISTFIENVKKNVLDEIKQGSSEYDTLLKLVRKNTKRRFSAVAQDPIMSPLLDVLEYDEVYKSSMRSLSEIEKLLKKRLDKDEFEEIIAECVEKPLGEIEVVSLSDKRQSVDVKLLNKD